ncbi:MAG: asparagine synthase (glutamine-hydrolyzing) [Candidatus Andersenbacteria bacterium CG10_big_fil_rev_8_21_14_0_10_54_11]|uniref:asparagine synthase (glutamine-hydrolyzing) n=1 Tax=Candidatus Andersenbacteria bacterium CG10_big_fil_rev_8_21_14_0_10_54_11 TaxID=1974485 RepID=A0A2M6WYX5_9BACT|nr:MAG: asparagine synthase (glutamine-hydrolyzing) [Candidatus Andersenbacteria bacterium CG10_big_fil_rev_8_21_14_0_10_54_11]
MCGIAGWVARRGDADGARAAAMAATLAHRGPDSHGVWSNGAAAFAHRRLSILDISEAGRQPMLTPDGRFAIVFNGEIYNFRELAERYCRGMKWQSRSDTEVLLHVLAKRGTNVLRELRGGFALALWDTRTQELLLARDPFGKKPLYFASTAEGFFFASEIKALLVGGVQARPDAVAVVQYLLHEYVPGQLTGLIGVQQLPAGSFGRYRAGGQLRVQRWWQPRYQPKMSMTFSQAAARYDALLRQAVLRRLVADVPVGLLLSGGLDSTAIGWYMREALPGPIHSFSVSFAETDFDESAFADLAARHLRTTHHGLRFGLTDFHRLLPRAVAAMDVPFADASLLPTMAVSELARSYVTVALDGDGSDELLLGYGIFTAARLANLLPLPAEVWQRLSRLAARLPAGTDYFTWEFKLKQFLRGMSYPPVRRHQVWLGSFTPSDMKDLLTHDWQHYAAEAFAAVDAPIPAGLNAEDLSSYLTVRHYLQDDILIKLDRATMAVGLESRTPFLDVEAAAYVLRLPVAFRRDKRLLRDIMQNRVPPRIIHRHKHGFALPLAAWLRGPLYNWARDTLSREALRQTGIIEYAAADRLLKAHRAGRVDARKQLWTLLMLQLWHERWA